MGRSELALSVMRSDDLIFILASLAALSGCGLKSETTTAIFQDARSTDRWEQSSQVVKKFPNKSAVPQYLVVNHTIYLPVQVTQEGWLTTFVNQPEWNEKDLNRLRELHPEWSDELSSVRWAKK